MRRTSGLKPAALPRFLWLLRYLPPWLPLRLRRDAFIIAAASALAFAFACATSPPISVVHLPPGDTAAQVRGDPVKFKRSADDAYGGLSGGYYVVRTHTDWDFAWRARASSHTDSETTAPQPPFPAGLDPARTMALVAVADAKDTTSIRIQKVLETSTTLHVWVRDTKAGDKCIVRMERAAVDAIIAPRIDKPVKYYVMHEQAEACGDPPEVIVQCRAKDAATWSPKITAQPGETVECEMTSTVQGKFAVVDNVLSLGALPGGSAAKLTYTRGSGRATFPLDVFGTYVVRGEARDEGGRVSVTTSEVAALPPRTRDVLVQQVWTNFDVSDDPEDFPRVKLRASEIAPPAKGALPTAKPIVRGRPCSIETPRADLCEGKEFRGYAQMKLRASQKLVQLDLRYLDERAEKGPRVCVQLYFDGARTGERCDFLHRDADEQWTVGVVDVRSGAFVEADPGDAGAPLDASEVGPSR